MEKLGKALLGVIVLALLIAIVLGFPTMWLWNYLMPDLFGLQDITIWQAFAMNMLSSLLFKANVSSKKD